MMDILGTHENGGEIARLTIGSKRLSAEILTLGSILSAVRLDKGPNMTVPPPDPLTHGRDAAFTGPVVGPVVNRLTLPVSLDGQPLDLAANDPAGYLLHSGDGGTDNRIWTVTEESDTATTLAIDLRHGLGGFPGNRRIEARWTISDTELHLSLTATTDRATLMNVAHHPYWALDGAMAGQGGHQMISPARRYTPTNEVFLPTGDILPVSGSDYDFTRLAEPAPTLDANLVLGDRDADTPQPAATLISHGGRRLDVLTTAPGIQVFTGKPFGIALEPQLWPNAPAHPAFPSFRLAPDETFRQNTIYRFSEV